MAYQTFLAKGPHESEAFTVWYRLLKCTTSCLLGSLILERIPYSELVLSGNLGKLRFGTRLLIKQYLLIFITLIESSDVRTPPCLFRLENLEVLEVPCMTCLLVRKINTENSPLQSQASKLENV